jgi:glycosyltransferase involved in cell wall biosynthesis
MAARTLHLGLIHHQFGPYHIARARVLLERFPGKVTFIQLATSEKIRDWRGDPSGLPLETVAEGMLESLPDAEVADGLARVLDRVRPTSLAISGYAHPAMRRAATWARQNACKSILISDSQARDLPRNPIKEMIKRTWVKRHFDAAFVSGATAAAYVESLGIVPHRIWRGYDVVDNDHFARGAAAARAEDVVAGGVGGGLRARLGLPATYLLYVGRFAPEKNLARLLAAFELAVKRDPARELHLVLVGGGPDENALRSQAAALEGRVHFVGFKQADELPAYYGLGAALLLPSLSEPWGLVINEAMAAGLPIIASSQCGAVPDLVFPGLNGRVVDPHDARDMAEAMLWMAEDAPRRVALGAASARLIQTFSLETWAGALASCAATLG